MSLSSELVTVIAGALALFVGSVIVFGIRYADKSSKLDEKSQIDELNRIRMAMRSDATLIAVDRLWRFLTEVHQKMKKEGLEMDVGLLLYDVDRRESFNKLLNDVEKTFRDGLNVKDTWNAMKFNYERLANVLYAYAATIGLVGFSLLCLNVVTSTLLSSEELTIAWTLVVGIGILFLVPLTYIHRKVALNLTIYQERKKQYFTDEVRIEK
jgi:ABC-type transport system involved in multi-copper enzyme maturation permease subunit